MALAAASGRAGVRQGCGGGASEGSQFSPARGGRAAGRRMLNHAGRQQRIPGQHSGSWAARAEGCPHQVPPALTRQHGVLDDLAHSARGARDEVPHTVALLLQLLLRLLHRAGGRQWGREAGRQGVCKWSGEEGLAAGRRRAGPRGLHGLRARSWRHPGAHAAPAHPRTLSLARSQSSMTKSEMTCHGGR